MTQFQFDATQVEPNSVPTPIPEGTYTAIITNTELKPTKDSQGMYLQLDFEVVDDNQYKGRKVVERLNLQNKNPETVDIARGQLSAICHAVGVVHVQDTTQLHARPLLINVTIRPAQGQYAASNGIRSYDPVPGATANTATAQAAANAATATTGAAQAANTNPAPRFDPQTGQPLEQVAADPAPRFDPQTGQPLDQPPAPGSQPVNNTNPAGGNADWS